MQDLYPLRNSSSPPGFYASRGTPLRALFRCQWRDDTRAAVTCSLSVLKQDYPACVVSNQATHQCSPLLSRVFHNTVFLLNLPLHTRCSLHGPFFFSRDCTFGHLWFPCPVQELDTLPTSPATKQPTNMFPPYFLVCSTT
eukprot:g12720.t1